MLTGMQLMYKQFFGCVRYVTVPILKSPRMPLISMLLLLLLLLFLSLMLVSLLLFIDVMRMAIVIIYLVMIWLLGSNH